ncbi:MAG: tripartite tricarboxylate transporter permease, partial [Microbacteriaceae bacterium]
LVGFFPGVTATMAVALASSFTLTLNPIQGLAVLLTIYVSSGFGDRIPAILINTPGTPASIATTFDGYPMAKNGRAGIALTSSAIVTAVGSMVGVLVLITVAIPLSTLALKFGPAEMFMLVVFGLTMMVGVSGGNILKGLISGLVGLLLAVVGQDPMTGIMRFTFGINELADGIPFIAAILGLFGVAEVLDQISTRNKKHGPKIISQFGRWWPNKAEYKEMVKPTIIGSVTGTIVGIVPAAGGDIAGIVAWDQARRLSKHPEKFGKGSLEGVAAADSSSASTQGGSLTTTLALGVPGDTVMAVMIGSMVIWGLQPGPSLFAKHPDLVFSIAGIMTVAVVLSLFVSLLRLRGAVKLLMLPPEYLWTAVLIFCMIGTYAIQNSVFQVMIMLIFGVLGLIFRRFGFPAGPMVLGLILGNLAESNLRRALLIDGVNSFVKSPIAMGFLLVSIAAIVWPIIQDKRKARKALTLQK